MSSYVLGRSTQEEANSQSPNERDEDEDTSSLDSYHTSGSRVDIDEGDIPTSPSAAKAHVESILQSKGVGVPGGPSIDLVNALDILATQLYTDSGHFIYELIQNADDNTYDVGVTPTIDFTLYEDALRIDMNETGFSRSNVVALCSIGRSSKASRREARYIGEKGIGFKSVFKIATVAHILSGHYSFKLDKSVPLGMISPIWSDFPWHRNPEKTSIMLELSDGVDFWTIARQLRSLNPRTLFFLRKLQTINILVRKAQAASSDRPHGKGIWSTSLRLPIKPLQDTPGLSTVFVDSDAMTYYLFPSEEISMPPDPRRPGCTLSKITLGFKELNEDKQQHTTAETASFKLKESLDGEFVFAFLPVATCGFKFIIQADFIVVANRQGIDQCHWNHRIIQQIPRVFVHAVRAMNDISFRYTWLHLLPLPNQKLLRPFDSISDQIYDNLSSERILESSNGSMLRPADLRFVPRSFRDSDGQPLLGTSGGLEKLSEKYSQADPDFQSKLIRMGAKKMSAKDFLSDFVVLLRERPSLFRGGQLTWHSSLANVLFRFPDDLLLRLKQLPIIPLNNELWIAVTAGPIFFADDSSIKPGASDEHAKEVDPIAAQDPSRNKLFRLLGVSDRVQSEAPSQPQEQGKESECIPYSDMDIYTLAAHAIKLSMGTSLEKIWELLIAISRAINLTQKQGRFVPAFGKWNILPLRQPHSDPPHGYDCLISATEEDEWFIADTLPNGLEDWIPILQVETADLPRIQSLVYFLGVEDRCLSNHISKVYHMDGVPHEMAVLTRDMRIRGHYLSFLLDQKDSLHSLRATKLRGVRMFQVSDIMSTLKMTYREFEVSSHIISESINLVESEGQVSIFLLRQDLAERYIPYDLPAVLQSHFHIPLKYLGLVAGILTAPNVQRIQRLLRASKVKFLDHSEGSVPKGPAKPVLNRTISQHDAKPPESAAPSHIDKDPKIQLNVMDTPDLRLEKPGYQAMLSAALNFDPLRDQVRSSMASMSASFYAELYVSSMLERILGDDYHPCDHWTSVLRSRAGHKTFDKAAAAYSSFTVPDPQLNLFKVFYPRADRESFKLPRQYNIEVCAAVYGHDLPFSLPGKKVQQAFEQTGLRGQLPDAIFVVAVVYEIYSNPHVRFFVDPWKLHHEQAIYVNIPSTVDIGVLKDSAYITPGLELMPSRSSKPGQKLFEYHLLAPRQIRLLELLPGQGRDSLKGRIHRRTIDSPGCSYRALSYVWGSQFTRSLGYTVRTEEGEVPISLSLDEALRQLRSSSETIWLWVDAVCINQNDSIEKTMQLYIFPDIYRLADSVAIWLGPADITSTVAMDTLVKFGPDTTDMSATQPGGDAPESSLSNVSDEAWKAVDSLLSRAWFTRVWIVQEVVWAADGIILCGNSTITWERFFQALRTIEASKNSKFPEERMDLLANAHAAYVIGQTRIKLKEDGRKTPLLDLLDQFAYTEATRPCDKIFALLGLSSDVKGTEPLFTADYDSSLEGVVLRFAAGFVEQGRVLDLLYKAGRNKSHKFRSWIPDWTGTEVPTSMSTWEAGEKGFHAGPVADMMASVENGVLRISGWEIDTIEQVSNQTFYGFDFADSSVDVGKLREVQASLSQLLAGCESPTGESFDELLLRIPIGDANHPHQDTWLRRVLEQRDDFITSKYEQYFANEGSALSDWNTQLGTVVSSVHFDADVKRYLALPERHQSLFAKYWETVGELIGRFQSACFFRTKRGYVGIAPSIARLGDSIFVFPGSKVPFVVNGSGSSYQLNGECYLHGAMYGETRSWSGVVKKMVYFDS